jgi:hypothetical protein
MVRCWLSNQLKVPTRESFAQGWFALRWLWIVESLPKDDSANYNLHMLIHDPTPDLKAKECVLRFSNTYHTY